MRAVFLKAKYSFGNVANVYNIIIFVFVSKFRYSNHRIGAHTRTPQKNYTVPYGTALLAGRHPRHFVPGYDRAVLPGQKPFAYQSDLTLSWCP
jgi:hypothetical protein